MTITLKCPLCEQNLTVENPILGTEVRCPSCGKLNTVTERDLPAPAAPPRPVEPEIAPPPPLAPAESLAPDDVKLAQRLTSGYDKITTEIAKNIVGQDEVIEQIIFIMDGRLHCDLGVADVVTLPAAETERRWSETTPQWPIMHTVFKGITRDQMMARHKSNHIQVVYAPNPKAAHRACRIKAAALAELGITVHFCGEVSLA